MEMPCCECRTVMMAVSPSNLYARTIGSCCSGITSTQCTSFGRASADADHAAARRRGIGMEVEPSAVIPEEHEARVRMPEQRGEIPAAVEGSDIDLVPARQSPPGVENQVFAVRRADRYEVQVGIFWAVENQDISILAGADLVPETAVSVGVGRIDRPRLGEPVVVEAGSIGRPGDVRERQVLLDLTDRMTSENSEPVSMSRILISAIAAAKRQRVCQQASVWVDRPSGQCHCPVRRELVRSTRALEMEDGPSVVT